MKIVVIGTRGFPGIQGGVETHCQELYTRLVSKGMTLLCLGVNLILTMAIKVIHIKV